MDGPCNSSLFACVRVGLYGSCVGLEMGRWRLRYGWMDVVVTFGVFLYSGLRSVG